jgi:hypothetical protein
MPALGIIGFAVVALILLLTLGTRAQAAEPPKPASPPTEEKMATAGLTREQIAEKLRALAGSKPPQIAEAKMAMCYKPSMPKESAEYVCPKCHSRTQYSNDIAMAGVVDREVPALRAALKELHGLDVQLDESELCEKCRPKGTTAPSLALNVKYPDGTTQRTRQVGYNDARLLEELLAGAAVHEGTRDQKSALKDYLPRLRELLGVKDAKP